MFDILAIASDTTGLSCDSSNSENEHSCVCCILTSVQALMILHRDKLNGENKSQQIKNIQTSCGTCLNIIFQFYKVMFNL